MAPSSQSVEPPQNPGRFKNAVEVANGDELIVVLSKLQEAVLDGSLDAQIEQAADSVKARFAK